MKTIALLLFTLLATPLFSQDETDKMEVSDEEVAKIQEAFQSMFTSNLSIELADETFSKGMMNAYVSEEKEAMVNLMLAPQSFEKLAADFEGNEVENDKIKMTSKERFESNGRSVLLQEGLAENEEEGEPYITQIFAMEHGDQSIMVSAVFPQSKKEDLAPMIRAALGTVIVE